LDTGNYLRRLIYDPRLQKSKIIKREKKLHESGKLQTPSFVLRKISQRLRELIELKQGVVLSGSPRTLYEAFGNKRIKGLTEILNRGYGKQNIFVFVFKISEKESIKRNSNRLTCSICKIMLLSPKLQDKKVKFRHCPFCGGRVIHRVDDNKEIIRVRLREYRERTEPIFKELRRRKFRVYQINGAPMPYKVHEKTLSYLK
jgi:adenylate kinase family enzyme